MKKLSPFWVEIIKPDIAGIKFNTSATSEAVDSSFRLIESSTFECEHFVPCLHSLQAWIGRSSPPLNRWYPLGLGTLWKTKHCAQLQLADLRFDVPQNSLKISSFKSYQFKPLPPRKFEQFQHHNSISIRSPCSNSELRLKLNFMSQGLLPVEKVPWKAPAMRIRRTYSSVAQTKTRRSQR